VEKNLNNVMVHKLKIIFCMLLFTFAASDQLIAQVEVEADSMLEIITKNRIYSRPDKIAGYRILIHNGSKVEADKVAADFKKMFPNEPLIMKWDEPNFKVMGGIFYTREEAKQFMQKCGRSFSMLIIINDKIDLPPVSEKPEQKNED